MPKPAKTTTEKEKVVASTAETVFFSWSPLSESEDDSSNLTTTTLLDTTGTPVRSARMPDSLFSSKSEKKSSSSPSSSSSLRSSSSPPPSPSASSSSPSPSRPLPSSFALVSGRLFLEAAGNYTFFLSSDGQAALELGAEKEEGKSGGAAANAATKPPTLAPARSPLKPFSLLLPSSPRALDFSIAYLPDPAAASHFLTLEWEFREGGGAGGSAAAAAGKVGEGEGGGAAEQRSSPPRGNRRAIERGAVWPSALVGPKCQGPKSSNNGGRKRRSRRLLVLVR